VLSHPRGKKQIRRKDGAPRLVQHQAIRSLVAPFLNALEVVCDVGVALALVMSHLGISAQGTREPDTCGAGLCIGTDLAGPDELVWSHTLRDPPVQRHKHVMVRIDGSSRLCRTIAEHNTQLMLVTVVLAIAIATGLTLFITYSIVSSLRDSTERKRFESELKDSRSNLAALVESTDDMIWSVDLDYRLLTFNSRLADHASFARSGAASRLLSEESGM